MNKPKVSVIIPVYNSDKFLNDCIDSVLSQSFSDFELILINDGSTDNSAEICDTYAEKDKRIKVFHQENKGVSAARNKGIENSNGKWITFIDSDDWILKDYLNSFVEDIEETIDFIIHGKYGTGYTDDNDNRVEIIKTKYSFYLFEEFKLSPNGQPFSKFFRTEIIKKHLILFSENINFGEDVLFILEYITCISKIKYRAVSHYFYNKENENSLTLKDPDFESNYYGFEKINNLLYNQYQIKDLKNYPALKRTYLGFFIRIFRAMKFKNFSRNERMNRYDEIYKMMNYKDISGTNQKLMSNYVFSSFLNSDFEKFDRRITGLHKKELKYRIIYQADKWINRVF